MHACSAFIIIFDSILSIFDSYFLLLSLVHNGLHLFMFSLS